MSGSVPGCSRTALDHRDESIESLGRHLTPYSNGKETSCFLGSAREKAPFRERSIGPEPSRPALSEHPRHLLDIREEEIT